MHKWCGDYRILPNEDNDRIRFRATQLYPIRRTNALATPKIRYRTAHEKALERPGRAAVPGDVCCMY